MRKFILLIFFRFRVTEEHEEFWNNFLWYKCKNKKSLLKFFWLFVSGLNIKYIFILMHYMPPFIFYFQNVFSLSIIVYFSFLECKGLPVCLLFISDIAF